MKGMVWASSSILKVLIVTSLQCLYNISKKKLWLEFIMVFIKTKTSTSWIGDSWLKQTCPKYQKKKFVKFLQYIKKKNCNCSCVLLWCKTFRYFTRSQSCMLLLVFANIPTEAILPGQSQFVVCCPSVTDWINLYSFLYFSPKKFSYLHNFSSTV